MRKLTVLSLLLTLSFAVGETREEPGTQGLVAKISFRRHGPFVIIDLMVDGSDPLSFIFDTGAGGTILNARTADRLGIIGDKNV